MTGIVLISALFIVYSLSSRRLDRSPITGPMLFTGVGLLFAVEAFGITSAADSFGFRLDNSTVRAMLEGTLTIVLFSDAVSIDYRAVRSEAFLPGRLLGIGLPLTILAGTVCAYLLAPGLGFWGAAVVAVVLAPTDAALGQAVVANPDVPAMVRQGLSVEGGLNDGIAVPFLTIAVAGLASDLQTPSEIVAVFVEEIGLAILIGLVVGLGGAAVMRIASSSGWMGREGRQVLVVFLGLLAYGLSDPIGGSGFIAAFVGGLAFGGLVRADNPNICDFSDGVAHLLTMASFFVFGSLILEPVLEFIGWRQILYAVLSLTLVRMVPVAVSLAGTRLRPVTVAYLGWFGPRGLASLVFVATVVLQEQVSPSHEILVVAATTVALSVLLHGLTAYPLSQRYATWLAARGTSAEEMAMPEHGKVEHLPQRRRISHGSPFTTKGHTDSDSAPNGR